MITEDYVSFETAKLLKDKGFDEATNRYYNAQYDQIRTVSDTFLWHWNDEEFMKGVLMDGAIAIPTLQMAMKWLLKNYNIFICVLFLEESNKFGYTIENTIKKKYITTSKNLSYKEPEEACEAAIKYCLENLI